MSSNDLTARARIRDAAIALFAERGIGGATVRDIAQAAGVSSGLLRHHFGSKEGLRDACDEYAMARIVQMQMRFTEQQVFGPLDPDVLGLQRYLVRSTMDGSSTGSAMWRRMLEHGEGWLSTTDVRTVDPRAFVAVLCALKMGMFLMRDQLTEALGADVDQPEGYFRMVRATLEIFSQPLLTPEQAESARQAADRLVTHTRREP